MHRNLNATKGSVAIFPSILLIGIKSVRRDSIVCDSVIFQKTCLKLISKLAEAQLEFRGNFTTNE